MRLVTKLAMVVVVPALVLGLLLTPLADNVSAYYAPATGWTYSGAIDLGEKWVLDATVVKDGTSDYKMWYTHVKLNNTFEELLATLNNLNIMAVLDAFLEMRVGDLFTELTALNEADLWDLIEGFTTAIGYATSTDGTNWTVVDSELITGGTALTTVSTPVVINDSGTYKMWYTKGYSTLNETALGNILTGLGGDQTARETAITNLMNSTRSVISYTTSDDWNTSTDTVFDPAPGTDILSSVGAPAVINDEGTLRMWYSRTESDLTVAQWAAVLADAASFNMDALLGLLDGTAAMIGYATSTDGVNWTVVNDDVLLGGASAWESVGDPCVVKANGSYEIWFTSVQTDLATSDYQTLLDQINLLDIGSLWTALQTLDINELLNALVALDLDAVKTTLSGTSTVIGYATSANGTAWNITADDLNGSDVFPSGVPGPWYSVSSPCVIGDGSNYTIWFTKGVEDLDVANLGEYLLLWTGDTSTIGMATYQYSGGGGGGFGGGGIVTPPGITLIADKIDENGYITEEVIALSDDEMASLTISEGTRGLQATGIPLARIFMITMEDPPDPPADHSVIGVVYDFQPDGATFDPPIILTITYDPLLIPDGVAEEDLTIAVWDEGTGAWVKLPSVVDTENKTISAEISGFSAFAVLASHAPASFSVSGISITPGTVDIGQTVTISATVTNSGGLSSNYQVDLLINDEVEDIQEVTLAGGESTTVSFEVTKSAAGTYTVNIGGLPGSFTVREAEEPEPEEPEPEEPEAVADIISSRLSVSPPTPRVGDTVTISVLITNRGDGEGIHEVVLYIDNKVSDSRSVTLTGNTEQTVTFTHIPETTGVHTVEVDDLSAIFAVLKQAEEPEEPSALNWWLIGGIIGCCAVATAIVAILLLRRRFALR